MTLTEARVLYLGILLAAVVLLVLPLYWWGT